MTTANQDPNWIYFAHTDDVTALLPCLQKWERERIRFGFYPGSVGVVATQDPQGCWAVEVSHRLFEKSFAEVW